MSFNRETVSDIYRLFKEKTAHLVKDGCYLKKSLDLNNTSPLASETAVASFVASCLSGAKVKADLLSKAMDIPRHAALDLVSNMCFFGSWQDLKASANSLEKLPPSQLMTSGNTFKISLAGWRVNGEYMNDEFFMLFCVFAKIWIKATNSDHEFSAEETVAGLFGNAETGSDAIPVKQFIEILSMKNSNPCENMLMHLLAKKPLDVGNGANGWGDISTITVRDFLSKKVAGGSGRASTMMDQMNGHIRGSCHDFVTETMPMIGMQIYDPVEFVRKLSLTQNSVNAKKSGLKLLEGLLDTPLLDVVKPPLAANGFRLNLRMDFFSYVSSHFDKVIVDNHPISNGYSISLYRTKLDYDDEVKIHRVVATVTDSTGALAGFADATFIKNPYGTLSYLGSVLDDAQLSDCNELALAATFDYESGVYHRFEKMLFITSWEVSSHHRRKGIGRALIDAILTDGIKGLGKPQTVLSAVRPTGYVVPPLAEEGGDNFSNYASDLRVVQEAWGECVIKNKALKGLKITYVNAEYNPIFHGLGNLEILALMTYQMIDY